MPQVASPAVPVVAELKLSVAEAVRRLGRRENRLREWRTAVRAEGATAFRGSGQPRPAADELRRPRADIERPTGNATG